MWRFKKRLLETHEISESKQALTDKMAARVAVWGIKVQRAFAGYMSRLIGKFSLKKLKAALAVFCLVGGGCSGYLIIAALAGSKGHYKSISVETIQTPQHVGKNWDDSALPGSSNDVGVIRKIRAFRRYMDSMRESGSGPYDSNLTGRRGLMDSLDQVEAMYQLQPIK